VSTRIMNACWDLQMSPAQKAVLISLADNANDSGHCWPSVSLIAQRTCLSVRAVHNAIKWLESSGILSADRSNGRHTKYVISVENYDKPRHEVHRRSKCTGAADADTPAPDAGVPLHEVPIPLHQVHTNHHEPPLEPSKNQNKPGGFDPANYLQALGVANTTITDWLAHRKKKKANPSQTAIDEIARQAAKAGMSVDDALRESCASGWTGFKAEWVKPNRLARVGGVQGSAMNQQRLEIANAMYRQTRGDDERTIDG